MSVKVDYSILNQKGTPAFFSDILANRPAAGFVGRVFISTDSGQIFEDNGTSWVLIADAGVGGGTLSSVCLNGNTTATGIVITAGGLSTNSLTDTTLTTGSVLFADGGGLISQSNASFFWDNTNKRLGIGTGSPSATLDVHGTGVNAQFNGTGTNNAYLQFQNAGVSKWRIGNTYNAGVNSFDLYNNSLTSTALSFNITTNAATFNNSITATSFIKTGGTSSQFLKADGSVDSNSYITLASLSATSPVQYNNTTGVISILQAGASQSGYLSSTDWNTFNNKAGLGSFSASSPLSYNNSTGAFSIQVANSGQSGYLTNTDWNTFNNKQAALTFGNLTETVSSVLTITGGTNAVIGTGTTIQIKQSSSTQSGYLSSTDWNTFNNKATALNGTGFVKASGTTITYDNSTYYLASNPSNFITLSSLAATAPLAYNNTSGGFSITQAGTSSNGYLSSTDWNTFNNKQSALTNPITGTGVSGQVTYFNGTTSVAGSNYFFWDIANSRLGIGTNTPSYNLDVNGTVRFQNTLYVGSTTGFISDATLITQINAPASTDRYFAVNNNGSYGLIMGYSNGGNRARIANISNTPMTFETNNIIALTLAANQAATFSSSITANGNVDAGSNAYLGGLLKISRALVDPATSGSADPNYFSRYVDNAGSRVLDMGVGTSAAWLQSRDKNSYAVNYNLLLNPNGGNVGIGTTSPAKTLDVFGSNGNATAQIKVKSTGNTSAGYFGTFSNSLYISAGGTYDAGWSTDGTNGIANIVMETSNGGSAIAFGTAGSNSTATERMRITSGGNVLIGTTTDNGNKLQVNGNISASNVLSGTYTPTLTNNSNITSSTAYQCQYMRVGNVVTVSGQVDITATSALTLTQLIMTLPISSNFPASGFNYCGGTAYFQNGSAFATGYINANQSATTVSLVYRTGATTPTSQFFFSFTYQIV